MEVQMFDDRLDHLISLRSVHTEELDSVGVFDLYRSLVAQMRGEFPVASDAVAAQIVTGDELLDKPRVFLGRVALFQL